MTAPRCATCKFWGAVGRTRDDDRYPFIGHSFKDARACAKTYRSEWCDPEDGEGDPTSLAWAEADAGDCRYVLFTTPSFGCVQWEADE